jgi:hypothetical protein
MTLEHDEGLEREHEAFAEWDAAYVLGALAPVDRRAYEDHLAGCERCRAAVAELAPLPGLLARAARPDLDDEAHDELTRDEPGSPDGVGVPDETPVPDEPWPDEPTWPDDPAAEAAMADEVRGDGHRVVREKRHRLRRRLLMGIAAVLIVGLAVAVPIVDMRGPQPAQTVALTAQTTTPLTASVSLTPASWGTRLSMECSYPASSGTSVPGYGPSGSAAGVYSLVITDVNGATSQVSTWSAQPGVDVQLDAATAVPLDRIASVQIQTSTGTPVLAADLTSG